MCIRDRAQPLYEFEPEAEVVLDKLLPDYIESRIFNACLLYTSRCV